MAWIFLRELIAYQSLIYVNASKDGMPIPSVIDAFRSVSNLLYFTMSVLFVYTATLLHRSRNLGRYLIIGLSAIVIFIFSVGFKGSVDQDRMIYGKRYKVDSQELKQVKANVMDVLHFVGSDLVIVKAPITNPMVASRILFYGCNILLGLLSILYFGFRNPLANSKQGQVGD